MEKFYPKYYSKHGLPASGGRFIQVKGEDGTFYDFVEMPHKVNEHIANLIRDGYQAKKISYRLVPPCKFRNFLSLSRYSEKIWDDGEDFYFCENEEDYRVPDENDLPKIPLNVWARMNGLNPDSATQKARRGKFETAERIGRQWFINPNEPNTDNRIKSGKYAKQK